MPRKQQYVANKNNTEQQIENVMKKITHVERNTGMTKPNLRHSYVWKRKQNYKISNIWMNIFYLKQHNQLKPMKANSSTNTHDITIEK